MYTTKILIALDNPTTVASMTRVNRLFDFVYRLLFNDIIITTGYSIQIIFVSLFVYLATTIIQRNSAAAEVSFKIHRRVKRIILESNHLEQSET